MTVKLKARASNRAMMVCFLGTRNTNKQITINVKYIANKEKAYDGIHFHYWTKHVDLNAIIQPQQVVEIGNVLADELGIANGDWVKVSSNRGFIKAKAVVTKRLKTLDVDGKPTHQVGIPLHWGFVGVAKPGFLANTLTPFVGDGNSQTPEFKSFLVNVEKA